MPAAAHTSTRQPEPIHAGGKRPPAGATRSQKRSLRRRNTTHDFTLTAGAVAKFGNSLVGVNIRLADEDDLDGVELRYPDGKSWPGEGDFTFVREPRILGR